MSHAASRLAMLSKVGRRLCDLTAGKARPGDWPQRLGRWRYDSPSTSAGAPPMSDADVPSGAVISYACFARSAPGHGRERPTRSGRGSGAQKREAPAVVGPGLSCRSVTTILADRDVAP